MRGSGSSRRGMSRSPAVMRAVLTDDRDCNGAVERRTPPLACYYYLLIRRVPIARVFGHDGSVRTKDCRGRGRRMVGGVMVCVPSIIRRSC